MPAVARVTARQQDNAGVGSLAAEADGDDDEDAECDPAFPGEEDAGRRMRTSSTPTPGRRGERPRAGHWAGCVEGDDRQYSPSRLRGWLEFVSGPDRPRPEQLPAAVIAALPERERVRYNDRRAVWHANIGPIRTPQLMAVHEGLAEIVEANRQDGDKAKPAALVDAYPGLGKSTAQHQHANAYVTGKPTAGSARSAAGVKPTVGGLSELLVSGPAADPGRAAGEPLLDYLLLPQ